MKFPNVESDSSRGLLANRIEIADASPNGKIFLPEELGVYEKGKMIVKAMDIWQIAKAYPTQMHVYVPITPSLDSYLPHVRSDASPAPLFKPKPSPHLELFNRERDVFLRLKDSLLSHETYRGKFVAIHNGNVVGVDENKMELAKRIYAKYGYIPIYIGKVEKKPIVGEMSSPERV